jgi:hypothetical protein
MPNRHERFGIVPDGAECTTISYNSGEKLLMERAPKWAIGVVLVIL